VDPDGLVVEQDEGNNSSRRTVVVQDADLYLTEPYFSPNGDGVKDETTLAWRATGPVTVVVTNTRGDVVRTLLTDGPEVGSVTWDGRDERGVLTWDGGYTVTITGEGGQVIGRASVDLDTNRNPIHDARSPAETSVRNLTRSLPSLYSWEDRGPAWMPGEDEALFILSSPQPGFPAGLLRVGLDGAYSYVVQDAWYQRASFASSAAVSPDGREALVRDSRYASGGLYAVDLMTGSRRPLGDVEWRSGVSWSPDGQLIQVDHTLLTRAGIVVADLCAGDSGLCPRTWAWSPTSDRFGHRVSHG
jgi:hypothetical protein